MSQEQFVASILLMGFKYQPDFCSDVYYIHVKNKICYVQIDDDVIKISKINHPHGQRYISYILAYHDIIEDLS